MMFLSDIEIAQQTNMKVINSICDEINIPDKYVENYGKYKAKIDYKYLQNELRDSEDAKLILVTAINPTPAGEGKTTTTIGLGDALTKLNKKTIIALREPSLGPVFGVKGGA
ncbi:MAG: formate--tetrahydrofolate ligase, partial [Tissierellia bacterium]|nr:formate--tetrahydrofolate ligase [Tissierellia bacterium]